MVMQQAAGSSKWDWENPLLIPFNTNTGTAFPLNTECLLLFVQLNNTAVGVDSVTFWDGEISTGNDKLQTVIPATSSQPIPIGYPGIHFSNSISINASASGTAGYLVVVVLKR